MMGNFNDFIGLYPLSKTLRFELRPIGRTLQNIQDSSLIEQDQHRAESYKTVKKIIDEYHKAFIDRVLGTFCFSCTAKTGKSPLEEFYTLYLCASKDEKQKKLLENTQSELRKQIVKAFKDDEMFKMLGKKELVRDCLKDFVSTKEEQDCINEFHSFTTYFTGFNENRSNMYSAEPHSTAIAYRLINENLPRFIDNMAVFEKIAMSPISESLAVLYSDFEEYLNVAQITDMFKLDYFNDVLTQKQIDVYNLIITGMSFEGGNKVKGLNEYINLYNQQQKDRRNRLPKLKPLYKQILSDRSNNCVLFEHIETDVQLLESVENAYRELNDKVFNKAKKGELSLKDLLLSIDDFDLDRIYVKNDKQLGEISKRLFGDYSTIAKSLLVRLKKEVPRKKKETYEAFEERCIKILKSQDSISIGVINESVAGVCENPAALQDYFSGLGAVNKNGLQKTNLFVLIEEAYDAVKDLLNIEYPANKSLVQDKDAVALIKNLLDAIKELQLFIKPLLVTGNEADKDEKFYGELTALWSELEKFASIYNMVRNYITKKPYSTEKIKLNFDNSTLLAGWDLNRETENTAVLLRKDGLYFLAIMDKKYNRVFAVENIPSEGDCYEKMEYKLLPGANKMLPKVFFCKTNIEEYSPSKQLLDNYNNGTHKKGDTFNLEDCHTLIDFYKASINRHPDWKRFGFQFSETETYSDISGFYREVEQQGYKITFRKISAAYIESLVAEGKIYLFQIYNKDFSPYSKGKPNLHTLYWKMLFDEDNLSNVVYKLNGEAEIFYRKSSIECDRPTHSANIPVENKNPLNPKKKSCFMYDLVKDRRYTVDKFQFHVPITMNFKCTGNENINMAVNEYIQRSDDLHIIGIDRGERNLLYLTMIDTKGNIVKQYSLNEIVNTHNGIVYRTDYHSLLEKREEERMKARQSWQAIENIKELKEGYLSVVIHKIAELMVQYNAIVVLEDLNQGFMRGRQKVESSVYQKFEKMLIDKLNYLVDKNKQPFEPGGLLNAYQLTNRFVAFKKMGKQCGFLFYTQAWNTSKIDPATGFVNLFDTHYENREKSKLFFNNFDSIRYNAEENWFEFAFDYSKFTAKADGTRTNWTLCTHGQRIENYRDKEQNSSWVSRTIDLTEEFKKLFAEKGIPLDSDLKQELILRDDAGLYEKMHHLLKLTLQMRNSEIGTDIDYLISPVKCDDGTFFNSNECAPELPENADANGAYNIARKGLLIVRRIKSAEDLKKVELAVSNKEWLRFAQEKPYLND